MLDSDVVMLQVNQQRLHSRTKPRGQDEKGAVAGTFAPTIGNEAWRDRFGSVRGGPVLRQRRDMVRVITHITMDACILYLGGRVFEVSIMYEAVFTLSMEVWVMCGNLREVRIRRATEGLGKYEVEHHVGDGGDAFCLVNSGGA